MGIFSIFWGKRNGAQDIEIKTEKIDENHVRITTKEGDDIRDTIAIVFTDEEIDLIDKAKKKLEANRFRRNNVL